MYAIRRHSFDGKFRHTQIQQIEGFRNVCWVFLFFFYFSLVARQAVKSEVKSMLSSESLKKESGEFEERKKVMQLRMASLIQHEHICSFYAHTWVNSINIYTQKKKKKKILSRFLRLIFLFYFSPKLGFAQKMNDLT